MLPDDYPGNVNSTNKSIGNTEVNPYHIYSITIGGIALSGVALYLTNKYCFTITKWPIMAYKCITRICGIFGTKINDNGMALSKVVDKEEADTLNSFNAPLYLTTEDSDSFESNFSQDPNEYDHLNSLPIAQPLKEREGYLVPIPKKFVTFAQNTPITTFNKTLDSNSEGNNTYQNISKEEHYYDVPVSINKPAFNRAPILNNSEPQLYVDMQGASSAITVEI
ncbi:hypothetical protein [Candidatus Tisiphia endosymbiont of Nemotelus uliginosus]|uniref:hypothetical protein n=1 Tax=Candidatus Tisiphia endosymbiont of Nemotelus uliginosus TaxID=3077926 RepID=UPI0035C8C5A8